MITRFSGCVVLNIENRLKTQVMITTRGLTLLLILFFIWSQVDCYPSGATEDSCDDIFPLHFSDDNNTVLQDSFVSDSTNLASLGFTKCFELIICTPTTTKTTIKTKIQKGTIYNM